MVMCEPLPTCSSKSSHKIHIDHGKSVVVKETPHIATAHHVTLSFNLQAVSGIFPPCRKSTSRCGHV